MCWTGELNHESVVRGTSGILRDDSGKVLPRRSGIAEPIFKACTGSFKGNSSFEVALKDGGIGCAVEVGRISQNGKGGWERNFESSLERVNLGPHLGLVSSDFFSTSVGSGSAAFKFVHALVVAFLNFGDKSNGRVHNPFGVTCTAFLYRQQLRLGRLPRVS